MSTSLKWTGERLVPTVMNDTALEHLARYAFCIELVKDKTVLDAACGEGYGTNLLADSAKQITGIDIDAATIKHAQAKYKKANVSFIKSSVLQIPLANQSFDVILSFETLEHLEEHQELLTEFKRLLKPSGLLILSTPNIAEYTYKRQAHNQFHKKELTIEEFELLVKRSFQNIHLFGQSTFSATLIKSLSGKTLEPVIYKSGDFHHIKTSVPFSEPMFVLMLASDEQLPDATSLLFSGGSLFEQLRQAYESTWSYKIGRLITSPVRIIKSLF